MSDRAKAQGAQCWFCPECYDDKNHTPGDNHCLRQQKKEAVGIASLNQLENKKLRERLAQAEGRCSELAEAGGMMAAAIITRPDTGCRKDDQMDDAVSAWRTAVSISNPKARDLRLQAEAVDSVVINFFLTVGKEAADEAEARGLSPVSFSAGIESAVEHIQFLAQRLRDQANQADKGGM